MEDVRTFVRQLSGHWGNNCYELLCLAVEAALGLEREEVQMKLIWSILHEKTGKSIEAVSRALNRAANDIWEHGRHEKLLELFKKPLLAPPTAKELVCTLADALRPHVEYSCWENRMEHAFGIFARSNSGEEVLMDSFTDDRTLAETLARTLTLCQRPLEEFRLAVLSGQIPGELAAQSRKP